MQGMKPTYNIETPETMEDISQDTLDCIRDGWAGWAGVFARDAARLAFAENPHLRTITCPECDHVIAGSSGVAFTVETAEGEDFRTVYLCSGCAPWFRA